MEAENGVRISLPSPITPCGTSNVLLSSVSPLAPTYPTLAAGNILSSAVQAINADLSLPPYSVSLEPPLSPYSAALEPPLPAMTADLTAAGVGHVSDQLTAGLEPRSSEWGQLAPATNWTAYVSIYRSNSS